ncbi:terpene cyclase [Streptomyces sp. T-3]|nr:terpene cyclase [Streptomyces sp. T-3]
MPQIVRFDVPFPAAVSPHHEEVRAANAEWVARNGLVQSVQGRDEYLSWDLADAAARIYHRAEPEPLVETLNFFSVGFLFDDQFDPAAPSRLPLVARAAAEMAMIPFRPPDADLECVCPLTRAWAALWPHISAATSPAWQERFAVHFAQWLTAHVWETRLTAAGAGIGLADFVRLRRLAVGLDHSYDIAEWTYGFELPVVVAAHPLLRQLREAATDSIAFMNDIHSYEREMERGEICNLVAVLHHDVPLETALRKASGMARDALALFVRLARQVPGMCAELRLTESEREATCRFVEGMGDWIRGNHDWAIASGRYRPPESGSDPYTDDLLALGAETILS